MPEKKTAQSDPALEAAKAEKARSEKPLAETSNPDEASKAPVATIAGEETTVAHVLSQVEAPLVPKEVEPTPAPPVRPPATVPDHPKDPKDAPFAPVTRAEMVHTAEIDEDDDTTDMLFPVPVTLTLDHHTQLQFKAGVQAVPDALVRHPYLKAHGVKPYERPGKPKVEVSVPSLKEFVEAGYRAENYDTFVNSLKKG